MKLDFEKAKKYLKEYKEDVNEAISELMDGVFVEDINDDLDAEEIVVKEDANKSKGKPAIHQTIQKCYYSVLAAISKKKLEFQEKKKDKIEPEQEKAIKNIENKAEKRGIDLLSNQIIEEKVDVYKNSQEKMTALDSDIQQTKQDIENYEQKIADIDNNSSQLNPSDINLLNESLEMEPIESIQVEQDVIEETSKSMGNDVQNIENDNVVETSNEESKVSSTEEERNKEIETIITTLHDEVDDIYQTLINKIDDMHRKLNNEVTASYEQMTNKMETAMKRLEQLKESHRKEDIRTMSSQSEKMIRSVGEKLSAVEAKHNEANANLQKAESTIISQNNNIESMQSEINNLNQTVSTKDKEIEALKQELSIQQQKNSELINKNRRLTVTVATLKDLGENPQEDIDMDDLLPNENQVEQSKTK